MIWDKTRFGWSINYKCGFCNREVASAEGFFTNSSMDDKLTIRICPNCLRPTFFDINKRQIPSSIFGNDVQHLPKDIEDLYNEARACMQIQGYTSAVMDCRKLLLHIAVDRGANPKDLSFKGCVDYLKEHHFTPPDSDEWVDHIRDQGNEANHEIVMKTKSDAEDLITFSEMLLRYIYEFPIKMKKKKGTP